MLAIGITGHRPHRLIVPRRRLSARVHSVLKGLVAAAAQAPRGSPGRGASEAVLDIVSPLAEGCDRIVAHEAQALGQHLTAILPFAKSDYETTFSDAATTADFRSLWKVADTRLVLGGAIARPEPGYVAVGLVTLARSDIVLTIWDGKPAEGRGGTPEILQSALEWGIPIIWIHASKDCKPVLLRAKSIRGKTPELGRVARRGIPVTAVTLRTLVGELKPQA